MSFAGVMPAGGALYCPSQDRALSETGTELRDSLAIAMTGPRPTRTEELCNRMTRALKKGTAVEGVFVGVGAFGRVWNFLAVLPPDIPLPEIVVESEQAIGLDWQESNRRVLTITVDDTPFIGFAALFGREPLHGRMPFDGEIPKTLSYLFGRLYPKEVGGTEYA